jgi:hypothetical protein
MEKGLSSKLTPKAGRNSYTHLIKQISNQNLRDNEGHYILTKRTIILPYKPDI